MMPAWLASLSLFILGILVFAMGWRGAYYVGKNAGRRLTNEEYRILLRNDRRLQELVDTTIRDRDERLHE